MPITCFIHYLFFLINLLIFHIFLTFGKSLTLFLCINLDLKIKFLITDVLLSSIPKLFEQILTNQLKFLIPQIISPLQHGFLKHRSVETNLFEFVVKKFDGFSVGLQTDVRGSSR